MVVKCFHKDTGLFYSYFSLTLILFFCFIHAGTHWRFRLVKQMYLFGTDRNMTIVTLPVLIGKSGKKVPSASEFQQFSMGKYENSMAGPKPLILTASGRPGLTQKVF